MLLNHTAGRAEQESEIKQVVLQEEAACGEETLGKRLHHLLDHGQALTTKRARHRRHNAHTEHET